MAAADTIVGLNSFMDFANCKQAGSRFNDRGIQFRAVALDYTDPVRAYVKANTLTLPVAVDEGKVLGQEYGIRGIPTTYFLNSDGTTAGKHVGAMRYKEFQAEIEKLK